MTVTPSGLVIYLLLANNQHVKYYRFKYGVIKNPYIVAQCIGKHITC